MLPILDEFLQCLPEYAIAIHDRLFGEFIIGGRANLNQRFGWHAASAHPDRVDLGRCNYE